MNVIWYQDLDNRRVSLLKEGYTYEETARILSDEFNESITKKAVEFRSRRTNTTISKLLAANINDPLGFVAEDEERLFSDEYYENDPEFCMTEEKLAELRSIYEKLTDLKPKKILSLSDLHSPGIDFKSVEKAILNNLDADICVLNGDVLDLQAMSKFDKMMEIDLEDELKQVFALLDVLTKKFKYVVWVGGNHDLRRFISYVMRNFAASMKSFVLKRLNPMDYIAEKYDNLIIIPHDWMQIGDVIFAHLQNFSSVDMKTVVINNEIFSAQKGWLPNPDYRAIIIGHTHHLGKIFKNGVLLIEQGCLCLLQDYKFSKPTKMRWETGYAVIEFDENTKVKFNETNAICIDK